MIFGMKKYSSKLLMPLGIRLKKIPANYLSLLGFFSAIGVFFGFWFRAIGLSLIFLFFIEFFDQLDGVVARIQGPTKLGGFLDSTLDRYGDALIFIGLFVGNYVTVGLMLIVLVGAYLTSYTRARLEGLGVNPVGGIGLFERTDRIPLLFLGCLFFFWFPMALIWTMWILALGTHLTVLQRCYFGYIQLRAVSSNEGKSC